MTTPEFVNRRTVLKAIPATVVAGSVGGTASAGRTEVSGGRAESRGETRAGSNVVEVVAEHDHETDEHAFEFSSTEIPSGWTTIEFENRTEHTHFVFLSRLPDEMIQAANADGATLVDYYDEHVTKPFQWFMDDLHPEKESDPNDLSDKYSDLEEEVIFPGWLEKVLPSGGVGLTSAEMISRSTVELDPGEYFAECYVKTEDGEFHSYHGMSEVLTVTDERAGASEPDSTLDLSLSTDGIEVDGQARSGEQTVAVHFEDQQVYEHLGGHDAHLIRLDARTTPAEVNDWINWMTPDEFVSDGSEPGTFVGGVQTILTPDLLEGRESVTSYAHVDLNPGAYAWVSEVPNPDEHGLLEPFMVPFN